MGGWDVENAEALHESAFGVRCRFKIVKCQRKHASRATEVGWLLGFLAM